jgi:hypothetical protein
MEKVEVEKVEVEKVEVEKEVENVEVKKVEKHIGNINCHCKYDFMNHIYTISLPFLANLDDFLVCALAQYVLVQNPGCSFTHQRENDERYYILFTLCLI